MSEVLRNIGKVTSKFVLFSILTIAVLFVATSKRVNGQESADLHVVVNMVQMNVAVTDKNGNYVTGLRPSDFAIVEDGIPQKTATFAEGNGVAIRVNETGEMSPAAIPANAAPEPPVPGATAETFDSIVNGANVYVLFDTSDYMYPGFVFAQDAITEFIRSLGAANQIAFYSYSRNLSRAAQLTSDRSKVLRAVRSTVAGDEAALYNALLLTLKDAAQNTGRKIVVVFSNGPDNFSVVPPEDVAEFAQSAGVSIYMISSQKAKVDALSAAVFDRMTAATGGKSYYAKNRKDEDRAFASIRDDLDHLYSLSYYPKANPNTGWRAITVRLSGDRLKKCKVRTRNGYRPLTSGSSGGSKSAHSEGAPN